MKNSKISPEILEIVKNNKRHAIYVCIYDFITDYSKRSRGTTYTIINFKNPITYSEIFKQIKTQYNIKNTKILYDVFG